MSIIFFIAGLVCGGLIVLYIEDILYRVQERLQQKKAVRDYAQLQQTIAEHRNKPVDENEEYMKQFRNK